jgi:hypothetical protein
MKNSTYLVNPALAAERFADEAVFINIEKGLYYSVQGAALHVYDSCATPQSKEHVLDVLSTRLEGADRMLLDKAFQDLVAQGLLLEGDWPSRGEIVLAEDAQRFVSPAITVFDDLAELIALDPVHEVDAASGWPVRPPSFPDAG